MFPAAIKSVFRTECLTFLGSTVGFIKKLSNLKVFFFGRYFCRLLNFRLKCVLQIDVMNACSSQLTLIQNLSDTVHNMREKHTKSQNRYCRAWIAIEKSISNMRHYTQIHIYQMVMVNVLEQIRSDLWCSINVVGRKKKRGLRKKTINL